jgi:hypothetical protein
MIVERIYKYRPRGTVVSMESYKGKKRTVVFDNTFTARSDIRHSPGGSIRTSTSSTRSCCAWATGTIASPRGVRHRVARAKPPMRNLFRPTCSNK